MRRLRNAIANANAAALHANITLSLADSLIMELKDGVSLKLVRTGEETIMDFVMGRCKELPIEVQLIIDE